MTSRKFYKTTYKVEILSEDPIPDDMDLTSTLFEATEGGYSGDVVREGTDEIDGKQAAEALLQQHSDPSFFRLTADGEDLDDGSESL